MQKNSKAKLAKHLVVNIITVLSTKWILHTATCTDIWFQTSWSWLTNLSLVENTAQDEQFTRVVSPFKHMQHMEPLFTIPWLLKRKRVALEMLTAIMPATNMIGYWDSLIIQIFYF